MKKLDIDRELAVVNSRLQLAAYEIWAGRSVGKFDPHRLNHIDDLITRARESTENIINNLKRQKEKDDAR
jgi:hypothetical protein